MKKSEKIKYIIKQNNYVGLLFFAIVLASLLYIFKYDDSHKYIEKPVNEKKIVAPDTTIKEITTEDNDIKLLRSYLNKGDLYTFKIYQSMYNYNEEITPDSMDTETMLYIAYKYIINNNDLNNYTKYLTCEDAREVGLENNIIQCGGTKYNATHYRINTFITKELLRTTILDIFNKNIKDFTNFYTSEDNICYYINNNYKCISHDTEPQKNTPTTTFIKAIKYKNKIEIIENYYLTKDNIYYKGFDTDEVGKQNYISTFKKVNGKYYWSSTKVYEETS